MFPFSLALCNFLVTLLVPVVSVYKLFLREGWDSKILFIVDKHFFSVL